MPKKKAPPHKLTILEDPGVMSVASVRSVLPKEKKKKKKLPAKPAPPPTGAHELRGKIVSYWRWGIANEKLIHYAQERPMERLHDKKALETLPRNADCSEFVTDGYAFAGGPDPNGAGFNGTGFTGTMISTGNQVPKSEAQPGDVVIFGPNPGHHVCGVLEAGDDPLLASHGQEKGPIAIRFSQESQFQPSPARFFRYLPH